ITAAYSGDSHYARSISSTVTVTILARPPPAVIATATSMVALSAVPGVGFSYPPQPLQVYQGDPVALRAWIDYTLAPGVAVADPTGSFAFYDGATPLGTSAVAHGWIACSAVCFGWEG